MLLRWEKKCVPKFKYFPWNKHEKATVNHDNSHKMIWGCMYFSKINELAIINGNMNAKYCVIIYLTVFWNWELLIHITFIKIMVKTQGNITRICLQSIVKNELKMPPQSLDLNSIGNSWNILDMEVWKKENFSQNWSLVSSWGRMAKNQQRNVHKLMKSTLRQWHFVIEATGMYNKILGVFFTLKYLLYFYSHF